MRKLATIREIKELLPIPGADLIELALIDGWQVVVKKGEFNTKDSCVYIEIDSILPPVDPFKFMEARKYRVRTIKLRGCLSQGLALPLSYFPSMKNTPKIGEDVTELLGITKYDPEDHGNNSVKLPVHPAVLLLCKFKLGRWIYYKFKPKSKGTWPEWVPKTDEERVQNIRGLFGLISQRNLYATEKLDGQSFTAFYKGNERTGLFKRGVYGVCSRNVWFKNPNETKNTWCNTALEHDIRVILNAFWNAHKVSLAIQGEIVGPTIQGNKYKLNKNSLYVYNIYDITNAKYFTHLQKAAFTKQYNLKLTPTVELQYEGKYPVNFVIQADGQSVLHTCPREGIVVRDIMDDSFSFKAISNAFLLKEK